MFAHFFNNAFGMIGIYMYSKGKISINPEDNDIAPWQAIVFTAIVTVSLLYFFRKFYQQNSSNPFAEHSDTGL
jgi:CAAX protease family protein